MPDPTLRTELVQHLATDQAARHRLTASLQGGHQPDSTTIVNMLAVDSANTAWLRNIVTTKGWPSRAQVDSIGVDAALLMVQHADRDTAFQILVLPFIERAYKAREIPGQSLALLTDRIAANRGLAQEYGTQAEFRDGRTIIKPTRDSAGLDARRATVGLPPMSVYIRVLDSVYLGKHQ